MKRSFINPEIRIDMFFTENLITTSGGGTTTPTNKSNAENNIGTNSVTTTSFDELFN